MRIIEHGYDAGIKLSKFKFNCDELDKSIPAPLPQNLNHFIMIVGKPGSSKTTLLMNMIGKRSKMYNKKFEKIYLFSPSLGTIEDSPFSDLPDDQVYDELSEAILQGVLDEIHDSGEKVLFIMDDVVNDMKKEMRLEKLLCKVLMNRRHQCGSGGSLSVWITSQVYNKVPAPVRKCAGKRSNESSGLISNNFYLHTLKHNYTITRLNLATVLTVSHFFRRRHFHSIVVPSPENTPFVDGSAQVDVEVLRV
eukprot:COSAG06_NODE_135_length_22418_cov_9.162104_6_plen_250_part_00